MAQALLAGDLTIPADRKRRGAVTRSTLLIGSSQAGRELLKRLELQAAWLERIDCGRQLDVDLPGRDFRVAGTCTGFLRTQGSGPAGVRLVHR